MMCVPVYSGVSGMVYEFMLCACMWCAYCGMGVCVCVCLAAFEQMTQLILYHRS